MIRQDAGIGLDRYEIGAHAFVASCFRLSSTNRDAARPLNLSAFFCEEASRGSVRRVV
jgi:hypothetical protein